MICRHASGNGGRLRTLHLSGNRIGDRGGRVLLKVLEADCPALRVLDVSDNTMGCPHPRVGCTVEDSLVDVIARNISGKKHGTGHDGTLAKLNRAPAPLGCRRVAAELRRCMCLR
eukprot:gene15201-29791_t